MPRLTARDFDPEVLRLFDQYVHGGISRRSFLDHASRIAGSTAAATGLLAALLIHYAGEDARNNDTTPRFDAEAAKLAWQRTVAFFKAKLA